MPKLKKRSVQQKGAASREMMRQKRISEGGSDGVFENSGELIVEGLKSPTYSQGSATFDDWLQNADVSMIHPIVTSEASMETTCDVHAADMLQIVPQI
ncbi:hypothetical protein DPMN_089763 [Dreissena polymorpha]|uniref:Uncharacterized protein n=1 Tax=Dreissena polymorpha TaxID=45954 RepID=A0A9D4QYH7_DREPO|nr:hypothetical protein DPMN_089763 [Dreissena polymorpha]